LSLLGDCDLAALDQPGAAMVVGTLKLAVGEKTGWFAGLECRYFGKRPLTEDGHSGLRRRGSSMCAFGKF